MELLGGEDSEILRAQQFHQDLTHNKLSLNYTEKIQTVPSSSLKPHFHPVLMLPTSPQGSLLAHIQL